MEQFTDDIKKAALSGQLFKDPDRVLVRPGFKTPASRSPVLIHLSLPGSSLIHLSVFHYHVNLRLSRQEWESLFFTATTPRMSFHFHGPSSTDYHAKFHM